MIEHEERATASTASLAAGAAKPAALAERRRPGRAVHVHPSLIGMLRRRDDNAELEGEAAEATDLPADDRAAAIGILTGAVSGMVLWALGAGIGWLI